jgi:replicative DNA helicase
VGKEVTVIGAHSGQGKTLFLGQLCINAALRGASCAYFTTETSPEDILLRVACALSGVRYFGGLKPGKVEPVYETMRFIRESLKVRWDCKAGMTPGHMAKQVERHRPDVVFVDYLQDLTPDPGAPKEDKGMYATFAKSLTEISLAYEVPVVVGSQFTKEAGKRVDKDGAPSCPTRHDLFGASQLANVASNVIILHQPERHEDKPFHEKSVELVVDKTRHGRQGVVHCRFVEGQQWLKLAPQPPVTYR